MNIAIVDDSPSDRRQLLNDIAEYTQENALQNSITEYESGETFLDQCAFSMPDVVFLDIYMARLSGMDTAYEIRKKSPACQIVFVSTTAAFAVQSYDVSAFYYILKPYSYRDIANVLHLLEAKQESMLRYITVKESRNWRKILLSDILYVDYGNHYVKIHTEDGLINSYMKFPEIREKLQPYKEFLCCYRCVMVNMDKIKKIEDVYFLISSDEYVPINRKSAKEIKACYAAYIFGAMEKSNRNDDEL